MRLLTFVKFMVLFISFPCMDCKALLIPASSHISILVFCGDSRALT